MQNLEYKDKINFDNWSLVASIKSILAFSPKLVYNITKKLQHAKN